MTDLGGRATRGSLQPGWCPERYDLSNMTHLVQRASRGAWGN